MSPAQSRTTPLVVILSPMPVQVLVVIASELVSVRELVSVSPQLQVVTPPQFACASILPVGSKEELVFCVVELFCGVST